MADSSLVPSPSHHPVFYRVQYFCILQAVKNWTVGQPGNETKFVLDLACLGVLINAFSIKKKTGHLIASFFSKFTAASFPGLPWLQFLRLQFVITCSTCSQPSIFVALQYCSTASQQKLRAGNEASIKCNSV